MRIEVLRPLGARLSDIDMRALSADTVDALRTQLAEHGALLFPAQHLGDDDVVALLHRFGDLAFTVGETPVPGRPELNVVTNVGRRTTPPRSEFHVDTTYVRHPPAYTALSAVEVPDRGGATLFTDQRLALDTLPPGLRARIDGRTVTHIVTGLDPVEGEETSAEHPLVRPHPRSRRPALYLTTPARCAAVSGLDPAEGERIVAALLVHSTRPDRTLAHHWSTGDFVIWDNACVMHKAAHGGTVGHRTMHRGMVAHTGYWSGVTPKSPPSITLDL